MHASLHHVAKVAKKDFLHYLADQLGLKLLLLKAFTPPPPLLVVGPLRKELFCGFPYTLKVLEVELFEWRHYLPKGQHFSYLCALQARFSRYN